MSRQDSTRPVALAVSGVEKTLGGTLVLGGVSFSAERGSLTAILGTSGSGKTTLLRLIAGLERPDRGAISLAGRVVDSSAEHTPPERRRIGYVPQEGALFPHLTVAANVSFGLRSRRLRRTAAERGRVSQLIEMIGLSGFERRFPHQLSGGERQRVALARALATEPEIVLLDEPFSSIDEELRTGLRHETVDLLRQSNTTAILVTHDQDEALSIADRVAVLRHGTIVQIDEPSVLYQRPVNPDVARFIGHANLLFGRLQHGIVRSILGPISVDLDPPRDDAVAVSVLVRPEQIVVGTEGSAAADQGSPRGVVVSHDFHGHDLLLGIRLDEPAWGLTPRHRRPAWEIIARVPSTQAPELGQRVTARVEGSAIAWITPADSDQPTLLPQGFPGPR